MTETESGTELSKAGESHQKFLDAYQWMVLARTFEDKIAALYRSGKIVGGVYLGRGQEAFSAAQGMHLSNDNGDVFGGLIRDQAGRMAFGEPILDSARTYLGSVEGPMRGRDGNIHRGRPRKGMPAMISHLGVDDFCDQRNAHCQEISWRYRFCRRCDFGRRRNLNRRISRRLESGCC